MKELTEEQKANLRVFIEKRRAERDAHMKEREERRAAREKEKQERKERKGQEKAEKKEVKAAPKARGAKSVNSAKPAVIEEMPLQVDEVPEEPVDGEAAKMAEMENDAPNPEEPA